MKALTQRGGDSGDVTRAATTSRWPLKKLKDITTKIGSGATPRGGRNSYKESGIPLIRSMNVYDFSFTEADLAYLDDVQAAELDNVTVQKDDILLNITGASVARCCLASPKYLPARVNQHVAIVRIRPDMADARFVLNCINSVHFKTRLVTLAQGGATREALTKSTIEEFEVLQPPLLVQQRIAGILSAYDELIENCQRRIKILEQMARGLYREWFIHFRYPNHAKTPMVDSPLGKIPKGWEVKKLKDACRLTMGQSPKSEFYNEIGDGVPFHQGVTDFGDRFPTDRLYCTVEGRVAEAGDILFSVRAPVGRMNIADKRIILGRGLSGIRHNDGYQSFLWEQLRNRFTKDDMMGNGAIFAAVTKDDMQGIDILCPPIELIRRATDHLEPVHIELGLLTRKIVALRKTRDLLLPRLMCGGLKITE